jgi:hypothetical protein
MFVGGGARDRRVGGYTVSWPPRSTRSAGGEGSNPGSLAPGETGSRPAVRQVAPGPCCPPAAVADPAGQQHSARAAVATGRSYAPAGKVADRRFSSPSQYRRSGLPRLPLPVGSGRGHASSCTGRSWANTGATHAAGGGRRESLPVAEAESSSSVSTCWRQHPKPTRSSDPWVLDGDSGGDNAGRKRPSWANAGKTESRSYAGFQRPRTPVPCLWPWRPPVRIRSLTLVEEGRRRFPRRRLLSCRTRGFYALPGRRRVPWKRSPTPRRRSEFRPVRAAAPIGTTGQGPLRGDSHGRGARVTGSDRPATARRLLPQLRTSRPVAGHPPDPPARACRGTNDKYN